MSVVESCNGELQPDLFTGAALRDAGIAKVSASNPGWVQSAKDYIISLARLKGEITADDLRDVIVRGELETPRNPNAIGAAFKYAASSGLIRNTGRVTKSKHPSTHARRVLIWERAI
jgi:hypothetical protein